MVKMFRTLEALRKEAAAGKPKTFNPTGLDRHQTYDIEVRSQNEWSAFYKLSEWKTLSAQVKRERPTCERCGERPSQITDHRIPVGPGTTRRAFLDRSNLQALCRPCHGLKSHEDGSKEIHRKRMKLDDQRKAQREHGRPVTDDDLGIA